MCNHPSMPYQSGFCGGSSFAAESLTVSTQAVCRKWHQGQLKNRKWYAKIPQLRDSNNWVCVVRTWDWQTTLSLEEIGVGCDELVRLSQSQYFRIEQIESASKGLTGTSRTLTPPMITVVRKEGCEVRRLSLELDSSKAVSRSRNWWCSFWIRVGASRELSIRAKLN